MARAVFWPLLALLLLAGKEVEKNSWLISTLIKTSHCHTQSFVFLGSLNDGIYRVNII